MPIPATATKAGKMDPMTCHPSRYKIFDSVLEQWQDAVNQQHYVTSRYTHPADQVHGAYGFKYARLDIGGSGAFMVEIESGIIYGIKGYGKVDKKKISGNIYDPSFVGKTLVPTRFRRGRFDLRTQAVQS